MLFKEGKLLGPFTVLRILIADFLEEQKSQRNEEGAQIGNKTHQQNEYGGNTPQKKAVAPVFF